MMQNSAAISSRSPGQPMAGSWWVVCLCAAWCNTCADYRATFDVLAREWPAMRFDWVDIEDEADLMGDLDIETFPTLLVGDASGVRFFGPLLPQAGILTRLLDSLQTATAGSGTPFDPQAQALFRRIVAARL